MPRNPKKINDAYTVGGVEQLKEEIKSVLGFSPHYYVVVDFEAFEELVDAIGGVKFTIPQNMNWMILPKACTFILKRACKCWMGTRPCSL